MDTKAKIENYYETLTKTEKQIADFIIHDEQNTIVSMTIAELSNRLEIGEASIIRFCRKVKYKGFHDLKFAIALDDAKSEKKFVANNYLDTIENNMCNTIHNTKKVISLDALNQAIEMISNSNQVFFYGVGSSSFVAEMAEARFVRIGKVTKAIKDNHFQLAQSAICSKESLVIAISLSGATLDLYEAVKIAKENKSKIIAITDHSNSLIGKLADCVLMTCGKENPITGGTLVSMTSQIYVIDLLCTGYSFYSPNSSMEFKEKVANAFLGKYNEKKGIK